MKSTFLFCCSNILVVFLLICHSFVLSSTSDNIGKLPYCIETSDEQTGIVLVSTLGGYVSALDFSGQIKWTLETGPGPLLKSNIHKLELTNNGRWIRMIPSLTGSLYKFDGTTVEAIPITADNLLTSSFRYTDDLVFAGGREVRTYGLSLHSGKRIYECALDGCKNKTNDPENDNIIVIERSTQAVRAIEPRSGMERWNFSVGHHNIKIPQSSCFTDPTKFNFNVTAVLPDGVLIAHKRNNPLDILWKYTFDTPIVAIWLWDGRNLNPIDLFSTAPRYLRENVDEEPIPFSPSIYVGMHDKQLYIHESVNMRNILQLHYHSGNGINNPSNLPRIPWKPIAASNKELVPIDDSTALSVLYSSEYVNGNGYYLYTAKDTEKRNLLLCDNVTLDEDQEFPATPDNEYIIASLGYWWKEVIIISITTAVVLNLLCSFNNNLFGVRRPPPIPQPEIIVVEHHIEKPALSRPDRSYSESSEYSSRYLTDFNPVKCLGRGGFGLVFEAYNKIDDCAYAIKRITLPNKKESRERVMREVKALAKLEHPNIVRYFNAWLESPPPGWQREHDIQWKKDLEYSYLVTEASSYANNKHSHVVDVSKCIDALDLKSLNRTVSKEDTDSFIVFGTGSQGEENEEEKAWEAGDEETGMVNSNGIASESSGLSEHQNKKRMWWKKRTADSYSKRPHSLDLTSQGNVARPADFQQHFLYIQMQLCRSESLRDWLNANKTRPKEIVSNIFGQIVAAVEYVHLQGLIHRDLKPSNIFFSLNGQVKIGDFGLVTGWEDCSETHDINETPISFRSHTRAVGTRLYMSPEQTRGLRYSYKVDIYSLGVILFELLVPFSTDMERIATLTNLRNYLYPDSFHLKFQSEYSLLKIMLAQEPDKRPTTKGIKAWLNNEGDGIYNFTEEHFELPPRTKSFSSSSSNSII